MKRIICLLLVVLVLLSGCSFALDNIKEPVDFYYLRTCSKPDDYKTYFTEGAIIPETREASGHTQDLYYLLSMYLRGPLDSQLRSPFPSGCSVLDIRQDGQKLSVSLSSIAAILEDFDLTLANACLAKTCMALADVDSVYIEFLRNDGVILFSTTITSDTLVLEEEPLPSANATENNQ